MNYRHHFHAGNFADVMKHVLLLQLLTRLNTKDKPYRYIDTHGVQVNMIYLLLKHKNQVNS